MAKTTAKRKTKTIEEKEIGLPSFIDTLTIRGARVHNLKSIDIDLPREKLIVITGISGSGKSSLAFDTIYAEGQRRYVESLSPYARQFLDMMERPDVDIIEGLSPAISIEQKTIGSTPRSTVGTVTEIYDFIRLLFARLGTQYCIDCNIPVEKQTSDQILQSIQSHPANSKLTILAPLVRSRKGHYRELFADSLRAGFTRVRIDGEMKELVDGLQVDRYKTHTIELVIDRLAISPKFSERLQASLETGLKMGKGVVSIIIEPPKGIGSAGSQPAGSGSQAREPELPMPEESLFSERYSCPNCGKSYEEPQPNTFSFNSAVGACTVCHGLGETRDFDTELLYKDKTLSAEDGGFAPLGKQKKNWLWAQVEAVYVHFKVPLDTPITKLKPELIEMLVNGSGKEKLGIDWESNAGRKMHYQMRWVGIIETLRQALGKDGTESMREWAQQFMSAKPCYLCEGGRLKQEALFIRLANKNIHYVVTLSLLDLQEFIATLRFTGNKDTIATPVIREIQARLTFLLEVGLNYLSLDRSARSLSGGESQRIRLATQIGTQLVGVLYILDEPSIGLHQRDNERLIGSLKNLRDLGNTVIVVEHDREMMLSADLLADIGPAAGEYGGRLVAYATPEYFVQKDEGGRTSGIGTRDKGLGNSNSQSLIPCPLSLSTPPAPFFINAESPTAQYLSGQNLLEIPKERAVNKKQQHLILKGATGNNLQNVDLDIPLGSFTCITGVSGSGKSTLINETLAPILHKHIYESQTAPLPYKDIVGLEFVDKVIEIDQTPIGRTPRSNPATYTGLFTMIRDFFAELPEAKIRGYKVGRFSFNVKSGRCETCEGAGMKKIEMNFLPDVYVTCDTCHGKRYNRETLEVHYKGKSISDVLNMSVTDALEVFADIPRIRRKVFALNAVGLGYIRLGQQAPTLSGGEAQRVKLATELSKVATGKTVYILDEPTTGLHFNDIKHLLQVLLELRDRGNTVLVIEHNMDVIKMADWIIDLGPEGGKAGGFIVDQGTPEAIAKRHSVSGSHTGRYLEMELPGV